MRFIEYFQKSITSEGFKESLPFYVDYMTEKNIEPEFSDKDLELIDFEDLEETTISHVLYHAELKGFPIDEYMI